jgi:hypothetical protein
MKTYHTIKSIVSGHVRLKDAEDKRVFCNMVGMIVSAFIYGTLYPVKVGDLEEGEDFL